MTDSGLFADILTRHACVPPNQAQNLSKTSVKYFLHTILLPRDKRDLSRV